MLMRMSWFAAVLVMASSPAWPADAAQSSDGAAPEAEATASPAADASPSEKPAEKTGESGEDAPEPTHTLVGADKAAAPVVRTEPRRRIVALSFGLMAGQPTGLQLQVRLFDRHALLATTGFDFLYRGLAVSAEYRATVWTWEFVRYDATLGLVLGVGGRVSFFEPFRRYLREFPISIGGKVPVGLTLSMPSLPIELGAYVSPIGFDMNALALPRWRPEAGLEARVLFPPLAL